MSAADRQLRAETTFAAPPEQVWAVLSDLRRMPELSPQARLGHEVERGPVGL